MVSKVSPEATSISFSPLIVIITGPDGDNFCLTNKSTLINNSDTIKKAIIVIKTVPNVCDAKIILINFFFVF